MPTWNEITEAAFKHRAPLMAAKLMEPNMLAQAIEWGAWQNRGSVKRTWDWLLRRQPPPKVIIGPVKFMDGGVPITGA
jgi:hypothetical protein